MGDAIAFAVTDPAGGVAYYRGASPANLLRARGHTVVVSDAIQQTPLGTLVVALDSPDEPIAWEPDILVLTGGWVSAIELGWVTDARAAGQIIIADVDDWPSMTPDNFHYDTELGAAKFATIHSVDAVTVSTAYLAENMRGLYRAPTFVTRNVADREMFTAARVMNTTHALACRGDEVVRIGYRGGVPWHRADLRELRAALRLVADRANVRFIHIGHVDRVQRTGHEPEVVPSFAEVVGVAPELVTTRPLVPYRDYPELLGGIDIGIIPLAPTRFAAAKSNIGGLELTAAGIPWLASPNREYALIDPAGMMRTRHWVNRLLSLVGDPSVRLELLLRQTERLAGLPFYADHRDAGADWESVLAQLPERAGTPGRNNGGAETSGGVEVTELAPETVHDGGDR